MIYFAQHGTDGPIKIGLTDDLELRLSSLQTSSPVEIRLLATQEGDWSLERFLHQRFARLKVRGEWFHPEPDLLHYIANLSDPLVLAQTAAGAAVIEAKHVTKRRKGRRAKGTGTIFKTIRRGREIWIGRRTLGRKPDGKVLRIEIWGRTQSEVVQKLDKARIVQPNSAGPVAAIREVP